jgi:hydrogenase nickel incorporation protein HypA/HybF
LRVHELGITRNLVAIVSEAAHGRRVRKVWLEIGQRSALLPDSVRFCFDVVSQGTVLEGATLEIVALAGDELNIKAMEVDPCA